MFRYWMFYHSAKALPPNIIPKRSKASSKQQQVSGSKFLACCNSLKPINPVSTGRSTYQNRLRALRVLSRTYRTYHEDLGRSVLMGCQNQTRGGEGVGVTVVHAGYAFASALTHLDMPRQS